MNNYKKTEEDKLIDLLKKEKESIEAPRKVLAKILEENKNSSNKALGRSFVWKTLINNLNFMNQKLKYSLSAFGIIMILIVGIAVFNSNDQIATENTSKITKTKLATTTPVTGNSEIDESINEVLNEVLNETDFESELADIELALADESALDEINNLIDDNEL